MCQRHTVAEQEPLCLWLSTKLSQRFVKYENEKELQMENLAQKISLVGVLVHESSSEGTTVDGKHLWN